MRKYLYSIALSALVFTSACSQRFGEELSINDTVDQTPGLHYVDNQWYTRDESKWIQMQPEEEIMYTPNYNINEKVDFLTVNLMEKRYIKVKLPGEYQYTNNGTMIRSDNGEIKINIYNGSLGSGIDVPNPVIYDKDTKYTEDGGKLVHSIVKQMDNDYTIVAQVGSNSKDWSFIRDMIIEAEEMEVIDSDNRTFIMQLPKHNEEILQSVFPTNEYAQVPTLFNDGHLNLVNSAYTFDENVDCVFTWLSTVSDGTGITIYKNKPTNVFYAETETGYSSAIFKNNNQYMYILYGRGEEARTNILRMIMDEE